MRAVIVGGGIGGLAAAIALTTAGCEVTVLEQAERFDEVGSGLSMWPNALHAAAALGLGRQLRERARRAQSPEIRDARGRCLSRTDVDTLERRFGPLLMVHRADLLDTLREAVPPGVIRSGVRVTSASVDGAVVHSGGTEHGDLVVGADGINSIVRASLWPDAASPRYAGCTAYRMITEPISIAHEGESWGRGKIFGYAPLPDRRVYCFAAITTPSDTADASIDQLRQRFADWHAPIPELLDAVTTDKILHHDLYDLPPLPTYVSGQVALLGDAAHAMTPNLGQGAGQAIEDAVTLAAALSTHRAPSEALRAYDEQRRRHTQTVAARSRRAGSIAQWSSRPAVVLRDHVMRLTPDAVVLRALAPVLSWQAPAIGSLGSR